MGLEDSCYGMNLTWYLLDADSRVGQFKSNGSLLVPVAFFSSTEEFQRIHSFVAFNRVDGVFVYDHAWPGDTRLAPGFYRRIREPQEPITLDQFEDKDRLFLNRFRLKDISFSQVSTITKEILAGSDVALVEDDVPPTPEFMR